MKTKKILMYTVIALLVITGVVVFIYFFSTTLKNRNVSDTSKKNGNNTEIKKFVQTDAVKMYNQNKLDDLINESLIKLKENPDNSDILLTLANAYLQQGNINYQGKEASVRARAYLQKVLKKDPQDIRANLLLGYSYELEGKIDQAIKIYTKITTELNKSYTYAYVRLGHAYEMEGKYDLAVSNYQKALKMDKDNPEVYANMAGVLLRVGKKDEALNYYQKALTLANNDEQKSGIYASLGSIYSNSQRTDENRQKTVEMLNKAIQLNLKNSLAYANLEKEYFTRLSEDKEVTKFIDDLKNIEDYYNKAVVINPNESIIYQWYGLTMAMLNKGDEAIKFFNTGVKAVDNDARLFGSEKNDQRARFYIFKSIIYAQSNNPEATKLSLKYLKMATSLNKNLLKDAILVDLKKNNGGYFDKIKNNAEFKQIISNN